MSDDALRRLEQEFKEWLAQKLTAEKQRAEQEQARMTPGGNAGDKAELRMC